MKKLSFLIIAVIVLVFHACTEKQEVVEQTHEDGTPKTVVTYLVENDQKIKLSTKQFYKKYRNCKVKCGVFFLTTVYCKKTFATHEGSARTTIGG